jgi:uncharacterized protein YbjT (DUF2867 family)
MKRTHTKVLIAWPGSYIGRRLTRSLLECDDVRLRFLTPDARSLSEFEQYPVEIVVGDALDDRVLERALHGIQVAYFPIRILGTERDFGAHSRKLAEKFRDACLREGVPRIVYLGMTGGKNSGNEFMDTMDDVGMILSSCPDRIRTVWLRAGFVLGSGSILFEILRNLVQKSPVLLIPRWMDVRVSTIGIANLVDYLVRAKDVDAPLVADIGLPPLSIREMLAATACAMGLTRVFVPVPLNLRRSTSCLLMLTTPFSYSLASLVISIMESGNKGYFPAVQDTAPPAFLGISPFSFETAIERTIAAIESEQVYSRWTDSLAGISNGGNEQDLARSVFHDIKTREFGKISPVRIFHEVKSIGGRQGWFSFDILWKIRGLMDKCAGGFGTSVGRRVETDLRVGDLLDVWKVVDIQENRRLLLEAQMKVFGKAWLEFRIEGNTLTQTAYHYPKGVMGRLYWYSMLPFHAFIFKDMIESIVRRADKVQPYARGHRT